MTGIGNLVRDGDIDYSRYTRRELEEAWRGINRRKYPLNHARLCEALERTPEEPAAAEPAPADGSDEDAWTGPKYDAEGRYLPNEVPATTLWRHALIAVGLLLYGGYGVWANDLYVPGRRGHGIHLHDAPAWIMYASLACASLVLASTVMDHFDRRDNERRYRGFAKISTWGGVAAACVALAWDLFR